MTEKALNNLKIALEQVVNGLYSPTMTWEEKERKVREGMEDRGAEETLEEFLSWFDLCKEQIKKSSIKRESG